MYLRNFLSTIRRRRRNPLLAQMRNNKKEERDKEKTEEEKVSLSLLPPWHEMMIDRDVGTRGERGLRGV